MVILFSGGLDSAVLLEKFRREEPVIAITFEYPARHNRAEVECALRHLDRTRKAGNVEHKLIRVPLPATAPPFQKGGRITDAAYFPFRNTVFLSIAAAVAEEAGHSVVAIGANADDVAGFPDCRAEYYEAFIRPFMRSPAQSRPRPRSLPRPSSAPCRPRTPHTPRSPGSRTRSRPGPDPDSWPCRRWRAL